jgi:hypothetical protein
MSSKAAVEANANNATLTADNFAKIQTNTGAGAAITLALPAASTVAGSAVRVAVTVAQTVQLIPPSGGKIYLNGSSVPDKYRQIAGVVGNFIEAYSDGVDGCVARIVQVVKLASLHSRLITQPSTRRSR